MVFRENAKTLAHLNSPGIITKSGQGGRYVYPAGEEGHRRKGKVALSSGKLNPGRFWMFRSVLPGFA